MRSAILLLGSGLAACGHTDDSAPWTVPPDPDAPSGRDDGGPKGALRIIAPAGGAYVEGTVPLEAVPAGGDAGSVLFDVDGVWLATVTGPPFVATWDTRLAAEGPHVIVARAPGFTPGRVGVTVDRTPPRVEVVAPTRAEPLGPRFPVTVRVTDDFAVARVEIGLYGRDDTVVLREPPWETTLDAGTGWATVVARAVDGAGNAGEARVTVRADSARCDVDGDGFYAVGCGGDDCDDVDPAVHVWAPDPNGDGVDSDCDGHDAAAPVAAMAAARVVFADVPADVTASVEAGCRLVGANGGTGIGALVGLSGATGLADLLQPDDTGRLPWVRLAALPTSSVEALRTRPAPIPITFLDGDFTSIDGRFTVRSSSFAGGDPSQPPWMVLPVGVDGDALVPAGYGSFSVPFLVWPAAVRMEAATLRGRIRADDSGFALDEGIVEGYVTRDALVEAIAAVQRVCGTDVAPSLCSEVNGAVPQGSDPEDSLSIAVALLGGYDARLAGDEAEPCDVDRPGDCNAVSVCVLLEMEGVTIGGLAP